MEVEANDNITGPSIEARRAYLHRLVDNISPGSEARAGIGAIFRELEAIRPGSIDRAHGIDVARRMRLMLVGRPDGALPDLGVLDWPEDQSRQLGL